MIDATLEKYLADTKELQGLWKQFRDSFICDTEPRCGSRCTNSKPSDEEAIIGTKTLDLAISLSHKINGCLRSE